MYVQIKDFWHPTAIEVNGTLETFELPLSKYENERGLCYEVKEVNECIRKGRYDCKKL